MASAAACPYSTGMSTPAPSPPPILQVDDLSFGYPHQAPLFSNWSAAIPAGVTLLFGDSGSGKSTLLRLLSGVGKVEGRLRAGEFRFDEDPVAYRRQVFWTKPGTEAFDQLTPRHLAQSFETVPGLDWAAWEQHIEGFGLQPHVAKPLYQLSTGSKRKALMAAGLASDHLVTLLDEPTSALDSGSIAYLMTILKQRSALANRATVLASFEGLPDVQQAHVISLAAPG